MSAAPSGLLYTKDHEWAKIEAHGEKSEMTVGITAFAIEQLGDVTLVNLDVKAGDEVTAGKTFGTIESVKTLSDLFAPVSGKIVRVNGDLHDKPELVNEEPYGKGWMVVIETSETPADLMDEAAYGKHVEAAH